MCEQYESPRFVGVRLAVALGCPATFQVSDTLTQGLYIIFQLVNAVSQRSLILVETNNRRRSCIHRSG